MPLERTPLTAKLAGFGTTIFAEMSALAVEHDAVNLGQGFPDTDGPPEVLDAAVAAIRGGRNQYPPGRGVPELRQAVADHQQRFWGLAVDPDREVLVTAGATEGLAGALLGLLDPGDEVVVFEPMYDSYLAGIALAEARAVPVPLRPGDDGGFGFDADELRAAVTDRTKVLLLNSPHNPLGKVFTPDELADLAAVAVEHDLIVVTDEVYEHLVFTGATHVPMATLPGMGERTLTISSGGKTFNTTGWKIGWATGPAALVDAATTAKQFLTYVNGAPFQPAIATGLRLPDAYFTGLAADLEARARRLGDGLAGLGLEVHRPEGTYFTVADVGPLLGGLPATVSDGASFCRWLPGACGVAAVPVSAFHPEPGRSATLIRFTASKRTEVLDEAIARLGRLTA